MSNDKVSRREFIELGAVAGGAALIGTPARAKPAGTAKRVAPSDRVRFGMVGVGMQGSGLLGTAIHIPGVECAAAADLYDGRHQLAREITNNPSLPVTRRYQDLLNNKDIDAIIAAVPDHWHKQVVVDAVNAGKDIYIEKPMSHSPMDGVAMVEAYKKTGRVVQVGSQRVSSEVCAHAKEMIASGMLGDLMMIEGSLGRNDPCGAWEYPPPPDLSPANLDWNTWLGDAPKHAFDPYLFARWRCWKEYGTGVAGDLLVHLVSGMMFMMGFNEPPSFAAAVGGIRHWKDGRNMPDVHAVNYYWRDLPVYLRLNLGNESREMYRFAGSKGTLEVTGSEVTFSPQVGVDTYPCYYIGSFPQKMRDAYIEQWHRDNDARMQQYQTQTVTTFRGPDFDELRPHLDSFFNGVRTRKPVVEDAVFGHNAALACHMANESYFRRVSVTWDEASKTIKNI
ncbi:MAG TPA: Gfo/Idh/MocA family oxidoreductase [Gemmatimonadaceae bacterium]|nr:Gfo/Idh/MocA family oxidoreductase [Gemmatimonadaceae bacterium]